MSQSDASIIASQAASLSAKTASDFRGQAKSDLASESGVTDGGLAEFPGATVEVGRGGMSGGGDNMVRLGGQVLPKPNSLRTELDAPAETDTAMCAASPQRIPAEHGGSSQLGNGSHASEFDESAPAGESRASWAAKTQPGGGASPLSLSFPFLSFTVGGVGC